jgi:hypothetical protein
MLTLAVEPFQGGQVNYFRVKRRGQPAVSLADQRQTFIDRWRSLAAEVAAA